MGSVNKLLIAAAKKRVSTNTPSMGAQTLLHLDGSVVDTGSNPKVWTAGSGATSDVVNAKFGSSYAFDGTTNAVIKTPAHADLQFGAGDFTLDCWVRPTSLIGNNGYVWGSSDAAGGAFQLSVWTRVNQGVVQTRFRAVGGVTTVDLFGSILLTTTAFHHIAIVRSGGIAYLLVDGVLDTTVALTFALQSYTSSFTIGAIGDSSAATFNGQIDEVRIIKGLAVWTSAFTPPTAPYSNTSGTYLSATGGTVTIDGNYKVHTFNASGTFSIATIGSNPVAGAVVEYLIIAGGGGGGGGNAGGGGAGGYLTAIGLAVTNQTYTVSVGAGGAGGVTSVGVSGTASSFNGVSAVGGGFGGYSTFNGGSGGSGGGSGGATSSSAGVATPAGQGNAGGNNPSFNSSPWPTAGGGGAGAVGGNAISGTQSGSGGGGLASTITGVSVIRGGGGGGGSYNGAYLGHIGLGGSGGGADGGDGTVNSTPSGVANTGGGGGGGGDDTFLSQGGSGGSGVVIIRYRFQ